MSKKILIVGTGPIGVPTLPSDYELFYTTPKEYKIIPFEETERFDNILFWEDTPPFPFIGKIPDPKLEIPELSPEVYKSGKEKRRERRKANRKKKK